MTRRIADPSARLAQWRAARAEVAPGEMFNAADLAKLTSITWRNLKLTIIGDDAFPVVTHGAEGVPYVFDGAAVLDHLIAKAEASVEIRRAREDRVSKLTGIAVSPPSAGAPEHRESGFATARDMKALGEAQMITHRLKREQGKYIPAEAVKSLLADMMMTMQSETLAAAARMDPAGRLDPATRAGVDEELRNVLTTVQGKLDNWLGQYGRQPD
jgi:hypothetical protein